MRYAKFTPDQAKVCTEEYRHFPKSRQLLTGFHHFSWTNGDIGVHCNEFVDSTEQVYNILQTVPEPALIPQQVHPEALSLQRLWYIFKLIWPLWSNPEKKMHSSSNRKLRFRNKQPNGHREPAKEPNNGLFLLFLKYKLVFFIQITRHQKFVHPCEDTAFDRWSLVGMKTVNTWKSIF